MPVPCDPPSMPSRFLLLQLIALWLSLCALVAITIVTVISFFHRVDCDPENPLSLLVSADNDTSSQCNQYEKLSYYVHHWSSYLQSTNIIILQAITSLTLITLRPFLLARTWKSLEADHLPLRTLQTNIALADSPQLIPGIISGWNTGFLSQPIIFVIFVGLLSRMSPLAVSSIYRSHIGPLNAALNFTGGGGLGPAVPLSYDSGFTPGEGITLGRSIVSAQSIGLIPVNKTSPHGSAPFFLDTEVQQVWQARQRTVQTLLDLDCGSSAPGRITQFPFSIAPAYWSSGDNDPESTVFDLNGVKSWMENEPELSVAYLNATYVISPGSLDTISSVIFFAANGTIEGAQQHILSPNPTSRITQIDVLVCTSTVKLQISDCEITRGFVQNCSPADPSTIPGDSDWGGVDWYIHRPYHVGVALSAVPAIMDYPYPDYLPMYMPITPSLNASRLPPTPYLTGETDTPLYHITLDYISTAMFDVGIRAMVQGLLISWPSYGNITEGSVQVIFATSDVWLQIVIIGVAFSCALASTLLSILSSRHAVELNLGRLLAISRDPKVDDVFVPYSDRRVPIPDELMEKRFAYNYDPRTKRWALRPVDGEKVSLSPVTEPTSELWHRPKRGASAMGSDEEMLLLPYKGDNVSESRP
ncbi:hypothetical protein JAAARDRAFT_205438 [Jaapia argillacea MUCL 33604]|uniref:Transmembrane protein n=1 Tax=Jaapia argillacea MUCL 33604 TaxID=933084 RepID=A0A067Q2Y3_9AGAM|nr:hypothetical protein JAAARDRAFT_205438 [Jaapia argillacea MUCL 33604]